MFAFIYKCKHFRTIIELTQGLSIADRNSDPLQRLGRRGSVYKRDGVDLLHYSFSITLATSPPHRVQIPLSTSMPDSIFPLAFPMPVIALHCTHHTLLRILRRMSAGIACQIFLAFGVKLSSSLSCLEGPTFQSDSSARRRRDFKPCT